MCERERKTDSDRLKCSSICYGHLADQLHFLVLQKFKVKLIFSLTENE